VGRVRVVLAPGLLELQKDPEFRARLQAKLDEVGSNREFQFRYGGRSIQVCPTSDGKYEAYEIVPYRGFFSEV